MTRSLLWILCLALVPAAAASPLLTEVGPTLLRLDALDAPYRVPVVARERADPEDGLLFEDLPEGTRLHPSYDATVEFCRGFDPYDNDDEEVSDAEILGYLSTLQDMEPLQEAFRVTRRDTLEELAHVWFRRGRAFEHVVCGESGGRIEGGRKLGGYHFWYAHYVYEREGSARYLGADYGWHSLEEGLADPGVVAGNMSWDADGPGGHAPMPKRPRGGFTIGNSVAALLALGHIGFYGGVRHPVEANLNGKVYPWTFYRSWRDGAASLRTLWPRFVPGPSTYPR